MTSEKLSQFELTRLRKLVSDQQSLLQERRDILERVRLSQSEIKEIASRLRALATDLNGQLGQDRKPVERLEQLAIMALKFDQDLLKPIARGLPKEVAEEVDFLWNQLRNARSAAREFEQSGSSLEPAVRSISQVVDAVFSELAGGKDLLNRFKNGYGGRIEHHASGLGR